MLKTIQIIAVLQGIFLLFVLFKRKQEYKQVNLWLLSGCIVSVMLYAIGDDNYNLFVENANWFLFQDTLIITFFFLFVRYYKSDKEEFNKNDLLFFLPYLIVVIFQTFATKNSIEASVVFKIARGSIEFIFLSMLLYTVYSIIKSKKENWLLAFIIPLTIIFFIDELTYILTNSNEAPLFLDSYGSILTMVFLLYFVLYKLIATPKDVLPKSDDSKYKTSGLAPETIEAHKNRLLQLMTEEKLFRNNNLTVNDVAKRMNIPRQHLSEILNVYLKTGFQDFLNKYRVEEFVECLRSNKYKNYTIMGIANEVGFSSKSSFNTTFKKLKGMTPSQYKKQLV
ncbi:MAG: AraC family transcriptional regulator [Bacteroidota bacterium]